MCMAHPRPVLLVLEPRATYISWYVCHVTTLTLSDSNLSADRNHWASFKKYVAFRTKQGSINTFDEFKNIFALTVIEIAWNLIESFLNSIQDMVSLKDIYKKIQFLEKDLKKAMCILVQHKIQSQEMWYRTACIWPHGTREIDAWNMNRS